YVQDVLWAIRQGGVTGVSHITGGGLSENVPRMLPEGLGAEIAHSAVDVPGIFRWLMTQGGIPMGEMLRTFNCGVGLVLAVQADRAEALLDGLRAARGINAVRLGQVQDQAPGTVTYTGGFGSR
ncbi:MAG: AIR synthase-related protein, partial [Pseudomonadota bacterium]